MELKRRKADHLCPKEVITNALQDSLLTEPNLNEVAKHAITIRGQKQEHIIDESSPASHYYILANGTADVFQTEDGETENHVATLVPGDTFGEEGLITGNHTATVIMRENGVLFAAPKEVFLSKMATPLLQEIDVQAAKNLANADWEFLDIRYDFEREIFGHIEDSTHIPLHALRRNIDELDMRGKYIVYCKSGNRSKAAAVLLAHNGFEACSLTGGYSAYAEQKTST